MTEGETLLLFGGRMGNGSLSNQLWQYNISGKNYTFRDFVLETAEVLRGKTLESHIFYPYQYRFSQISSSCKYLRTRKLKSYWYKDDFFPAMWICNYAYVICNIQIRIFDPHWAPF